MNRLRVSTTVDPALWNSARQILPGRSHAQVLDGALRSLLLSHRGAEIDAAYERAYRDHPPEEADDWGELRRSC